MAVDEFSGRSFAESATPLDTIFKIAHNSGATSVLYVVDRPVSNWIKTNACCMDMEQKVPCKEEGSNGSSMSGDDALKSIGKKFREKLDPRKGGLSVATRTPTPAQGSK